MIIYTYCMHDILYTYHYISYPYVTCYLRLDMIRLWLGSHTRHTLMATFQPNDTTSKQRLPACNTEGCTSLSKRSRRCSSCAFEYWAIKGTVPIVQGKHGNTYLLASFWNTTIKKCWKVQLLQVFTSKTCSSTGLILGSISMSLLQILCNLCSSTY